MIYAKIINQGKEYLFEPIQLNKEKILCVEVYNINKYLFSFSWEQVVGVGIIEVLATNDGLNFIPMVYGDNQPMILTIDIENGFSHFADYIGHNAKYLCFKLSGFTDGYLKGIVNFV